MLILHKGFTLVEMLTMLAILSIASAIAVPSFTHFKHSHQADSAILRLANAIRITKLTAIDQQQRTIICPKPIKKSCGRDWSGDLIVFGDKNDNRMPDDNEGLTHIPANKEPSTRILFNSLSTMIRYSGSGFPMGTFGSFIFCPPSHKKEYVRKLVINMQGQIKSKRLSAGQKEQHLKQC